MVSDPTRTLAPVRAAIYTRISRDRDGDQLGVNRQERLCRRICATRGWAVVQVYTDDDVSATGSKPRPAFEQLLADLEHGHLDVIVALDSDRLLRKPGDLERLFTLAEKHQIRVAYEHGGFDPITQEGMFEARIRAAVDAEEVAKLRRRVRRKARELAEQGRPGGAGRPFGYELDRITIRAEEAAVIREAADRILAGETMHRIVKDLGQRGVVSPSGRPWKQGPFTRMLTSARIAGLRSHHGEIVARGTWPGILGEEAWTALRAVLLDPGRAAGGTARRYLLTGFVHCGACDARLRARPTAQHVRRYVCVPPPAGEGCGHRYVRADWLEDEVVERVLGRLATPAVAAALADHGRDDQLGELVRGAGELRDRLEQLAVARYADATLSDAEYRAARASLVARLDALERRIDRSRSTAHLSAVRVPDRAAWDLLGFDARRIVLRSLIDRVVVGEGRRGYNRWQPDRCGIRWRA